MKLTLATTATALIVLAVAGAQQQIANGPAEYQSIVEAADLKVLNEVGSLIVGGTEAPMYKYPFNAGMRDTSSGSSFCGGSLIAPDVVLTAAHCLSIPWASVGTHYRSGTSDGARRKVVRTVQHPNYRASTSDYDFALLFLESAVSTKTIRLASNTGGDEAVGRTATVTGWGLTSESGGASNVLREVDVNIVSNSQCEQAVGGITSRMICAGGIRGKDSCQGDSGGPLFVNKNGTPILVGDVSWGVGCAREGLPGVYGRISSVRSWIDSNVNSFSANAQEVQWEEVAWGGEQNVTGY